MNTTTGKTALILVDIQPTFCEDGELPVKGGNQVAADTAEYLRTSRGLYDFVATSQDEHIDPGDHFSETPDFVDSWPPHGVVGTANAEVHPLVAAALAETSNGTGADIVVTKGAYEAAYSAFDGIDENGGNLADVLRAAGVTDVDVCGIAESHCVKATAIDAIKAGFTTRLLTDLTVPVTEELGLAARAEMAEAGTISLTSSARNTELAANADTVGTAR